MGKVVIKYRENLPFLPTDADHCRNCTHLDMCLGLRYAQPSSSPDNARKQCNFFHLWPICEYCGQRKDEVGKEYVEYMCRNKGCSGGRQ